jgi:nucleotide-binding universal stress UspA family protein
VIEQIRRGRHHLIVMGTAPTHRRVLGRRPGRRLHAVIAPLGGHRADRGTQFIPPAANVAQRCCHPCLSIRPMSGELVEDRPTLFCFDGSEGSRAALRAGSRRLRQGRAVVLTVWETIGLRVARRAFAGGTTVPNEQELDDQEEAAARAAAEDGARAAREHGWDAEARVARAETTEWRTIVDVADEIDAALIVCGTRGLSGLRGLVLGSVSHAVLEHAGRPVLIAPAPPVSES